MADRPTLVSLPSLDDLYAIEPEGFVAARNALAKQLKAAGDKETAAEVTKLRRPPVSAWALNQVARTQAEVVEEVLGAAAALADALADPGSTDLRGAQRGFRAAIETVVRAALGVVAGSGRSPSAGVQQAVQATLQAAAVDEGIALALRAGVLAEDEPAPGFLLTGDAPPPKQTSTKAEADAATSRPKVIGGRKKRPVAAPAPASAPVEAAPEVTAAERKAARAEQARLEAEEREAERRRRSRLAELRTEAKRLDRRAERLATAADHAEAAAVSARSEADEARAEADAVLAALDAAEREG